MLLCPFPKPSGAPLSLIRARTCHLVDPRRGYGRKQCCATRTSDRMGSGPEAASGSHPGAEQSISKKRVLIVGAGAAGTACAWALGRSEQFLVEVWEKCEVAGGQATTVTLRDGRPLSPVFAAWGLRINDGVQGGTPSYRNTLNLLELCGMQPHYVNLRICFGMGEKRWNNFGEKTELIRKNKEQIVRFGRVLKTVSKYETFFVPIPIKTLLWMYGFSKEFMYDMVFPLTALFFGTGNQTPNVSSAIFARVFTDADLKLFEYDNETLLSQAPTMFAFRELEDYYKKLVDITNARFSFGRSAARITRTKKNVTVVDNNGSTSEFDEIIFACSPETSLSMLTKPTRMERTTLGSVKFYNDVTVTHEDMDYMKKHYDLNLARNEMYFIKTYKEDPSKVHCCEQRRFGATSYA
eukprot:scaffold7390_cov420-Prasinococcus_capsulatus_cf.AAC.10